jgi:hypothetical protein
MITIPFIKETVENYFNLTPGSVDLKKIDSDIVLARQICHYFAKNKTIKTLKQIGIEIGSQHHATVLHSIGEVECHVGSNDLIGNYINEINILLTNTKTKINLFVDNPENNAKKAQIMCLLKDIYGENSLQEKLIQSIFCCD